MAANVVFTKFNLLLKKPANRRLIGSTQIKCEKVNTNDQVCGKVVNKNPRNLEQLRIGRKPKGWFLEHPPREYWNKLFFNDDKRCVTGRVIHNSGKVIIRASSSEVIIAKYLSSVTDVNAAVNVARVLAERCLRAGILHVHTSFSEAEMKREKIRLFLETLEKNGVGLTEPDTLVRWEMFRGH